MGSLMASKISILLFILILGSLLSASFGGRESKFFTVSKVQVGGKTQGSSKTFVQDKRATYPSVPNPRVKTNDYGSYDPAPALGKPPFKLIPN